MKAFRALTGGDNVTAQAYPVLLKRVSPVVALKGEAWNAGYVAQGPCLKKMTECNESV